MAGMTENRRASEAMVVGTHGRYNLSRAQQIVVHCTGDTKMGA